MTTVEKELERIVRMDTDIQYIKLHLQKMETKLEQMSLNMERSYAPIQRVEKLEKAVKELKDDEQEKSKYKSRWWWDIVQKVLVGLALVIITAYITAKNTGGL